MDAMGGTSGPAALPPIPEEATTATGSGAAEHTASAASPPHQGVPWFLDTHRLAQKPDRYRVKFYGARNEKSKTMERYCYAGVGGVDNDWSIPIHAFKMQDLIGKRLVMLERRFGIEGYQIARDSKGVVIESEAPVSGFVARNGDARCYGELMEVADDYQMVHVTFNMTPVKEKWENVAKANLDEVKTPDTPSTPRSDSDG